MNTTDLELTKPSLTSIYNQLSEIRGRLAALSGKLSNVHEPQPMEADKAGAVNQVPDYSVSAINDKVSSIDYYLRNCEDTLAKIVG